MKYLFLFILLTVSASSLMGQGKSKLNDDKKELSALKSEHEKLSPPDFQKDIDALEEILKSVDDEIEKETDENAKKYLIKVKEIYEIFIERLPPLLSYWNTADSLINRLEFSQKSIIDSLELSDKIASNKEYDRLRGVTGYEKTLKEFRALRKRIKKLETKLVLKLIGKGTQSYLFNYKVSRPFAYVTNQLHKYLDKTAHANTKELEQRNENLYDIQKELKKKVDSLEVEISEGINCKEGIDSTLEVKNKELAKKQDLLNKLNLENKTYFNRNKTLEEERESLLIGASVLKHDIDTLNNAKSNLESENEKLNSSTDYLKLKVENLKCDADSISLYSEKLQKDFNRRSSVLNEYLMLSVFSLLTFLLIILYILYRKNKTKGKLKRAYLKLSDTQEELKQRNKNLSDTQKELKQKNESLYLSHLELHHRTKNTIQQISALIYMQLCDIHEDKGEAAALQELDNRVNAIKIVHEKLYSQNDKNRKLTIVNIKEYINDLVIFILGKNVKTELNIQNIDIEMDDAVYVGLIVNELLTNARKYAFTTTNNSPVLFMRICENNNFLEIEVKDNGPGFPDNFSLEKSLSFGLSSFIKNLVLNRSIEGKFEIKNNDGAHINIAIPFDRKQNQFIS